MTFTPPRHPPRPSFNNPQRLHLALSQPYAFLWCNKHFLHFKTCFWTNTCSRRGCGTLPVLLLLAYNFMLNVLAQWKKSQITMANTIPSSCPSFTLSINRACSGFLYLPWKLGGARFEASRKGKHYRQKEILGITINAGHLWWLE